MSEAIKTAEELTEEAKDLIESLRVSAKESFSDGVSFKKAVRFVYESVSELIEFAEDATKEIKGLGSEKKKFVVETVRKLYKDINADIPWIPEPLESFIENLILENIVPPAIDWLVSKYNKYGVFN